MRGFPGVARLGLVTSTFEAPSYQELAVREQTGITVRLVWDAGANQVWLTYADRREQEQFTTPAADADALEAFRHPNAFRPLREG
jgi:hypothetical protein